METKKNFTSSHSLSQIKGSTRCDVRYTQHVSHGGTIFSSKLTLQECFGCLGIYTVKMPCICAHSFTTAKGMQVFKIDIIEQDDFEFCKEHVEGERERLLVDSILDATRLCMQACGQDLVLRKKTLEKAF